MRLFSSRKVDKGTLKFELLVDMAVVSMVNHGRPLVNSYRELLEYTGRKNRKASKVKYDRN